MGQILRVSVAMHVLFHIESDAPIADSISNEATEAAINFVEVCCQHTAYISGWGKIDDELELVVAGEGVIHETVHGPQQESNKTLLLNLPGKFLDVSFWVHQKRKFWNRGGIEGALQALTKLQEDGMGKLKAQWRLLSSTRLPFRKILRERQHSQENWPRNTTSPSFNIQGPLKTQRSKTNMAQMTWKMVKAFLGNSLQVKWQHLGEVQERLSEVTVKAQERVPKVHHARASKAHQSASTCSIQTSYCCDTNQYLFNHIYMTSPSYYTT